jgi:hypothetical protein
VLTSTVSGPASVAIRDSSGSVVFEQQAQPQPKTPDDHMRNEEASGGAPTLPLAEGSYTAECRSGDGVGTTAPLRVAWAEPGSVEQEKSVFLRVFETPDHWK